MASIQSSYFLIIIGSILIMAPLTAFFFCLCLCVCLLVCFFFFEIVFVCLFLFIIIFFFLWSERLLIVILLMPITTTMLYFILCIREIQELCMITISLFLFRYSPLVSSFLLKNKSFSKHLFIHIYINCSRCIFLYYYVCL